MTEQNPAVKVFPSTKDAAEDERDEKGMGSIGAVIEQWRQDSTTLRMLRKSGFKADMNTRGGGDE